MKPIYHLYCLICLMAFTVISCSECCEGNAFEFRARIELTVKKNDTLELVYTNQASKTASIVKIVEGKDEPQFVEFCLNEEPVDLAFQFGNELKEYQLKIASLLLENKDYQLFIREGHQFHMYFQGNQNITYLKDTNTYQFSRADEVTNTPVLNARKPMKTRLKKRLQL
ncbi:hypothetical protein ACU8DI_03640 [Psychroserpens sp. BH13MA-6]